MMGDYVEQTLKAIEGVEAQFKPRESWATPTNVGIENNQFWLLYSQLAETKGVLGGLTPILEGDKPVHRELYRVVKQIETLTRGWGSAGVHNDEPVLTKWLEYFLEILLAVRWWTMVAALQAGQQYASSYIYRNLHLMIGKLLKGVSQVNPQSSIISSCERHFPSFGFEIFQKKPESSPLVEILQWKIESGNILGDDEDKANMALETIRNANLPGFIIEDMLVNYVDEATSPLIEEGVTLDLTQDVLGVSPTGSWVIRTKFEGVDCALKRVIGGDSRQPVIARLSHPHIVQLMHFWRKDEGLFLMMELMEGDLTDLLSRHKRANQSLLSLPVVVDIMLQTAKGMLYLHDLDITYPHLNCSNVLFRASDTLQDGYIEYIIKLSEGGYSIRDVSNMRDDFSLRKSQDVYHFGLFCLEVLTGSQQCEDSLGNVADTGPSIPETIPPILKFCMASCFAGNLQFGFGQVITLLLLAQYQALKSQKDEAFLSFGSKDRETVQLKQPNCVYPSTSDADLETYPIHQLYPEPDVQGSDSNPSATLIFFHGFAKSPDEWETTWMTRNREHVWPKAWLPKDLPGSVRILSLSYDTNALGEGQDVGAIEIGKNVLRLLVLSPKLNLAHTKKKVILIGHSFGGLIIKSLVTEAQNLVESPMEPSMTSKVEPKMEPKVEPKVEPKLEPKVEPKLEPKMEPKVEPKMEPKVEPKMEPKVEPKMEPKVEEAKVEPKMEAHLDEFNIWRTKAKMEPELEEFKVEPKMKSKMESESEPESEDFYMEPTLEEFTVQEQLVENCRFFLENLKGIVFYSVPGSASDQDQQFEQYIVKLNQTGVLQRSSLMQALLKNKGLFNQQMQVLDSQFEKNVPEKTKILCFIEGKVMRRIREKMQVVVSESSARAQLKADFHILEEDNHFEVCRPVSTDHKGYKILVEDFLKGILEIGSLNPVASDDDGCAGSKQLPEDADDNEPKSKRRKKNKNAKAKDVVVVETKSDLDTVDDGCDWHKYYQKVQKGSAHPRRYYRCRTLGCPVRKHVARSSKDSKCIVTTYVGIHNHIEDQDVAARITVDVAEFHEWIVATVTRCDGEANIYEVIAKDPEDEGHGPRKYKRPSSCIIPLPKRSDASRAPDFPVGSQVLAVYPGTTALYQAAVVEPQRKDRRDEYSLEFGGDEEGQAGLPTKIVPFYHVVQLPSGHLPSLIQVNNAGGPTDPQNDVSEYDLPTTVVRTFDQGSCVMSMDFHPIVQNILLVGTKLGDIGIWDVSSPEKLVERTFEVWDFTSASWPFRVAFSKNPAVSVNRTVWSPDGTFLGVAFSKHIVHIYSFSFASDLRRDLELGAHVGGVNDLAFCHPNEQLCVITCGDDKLIKVWDAGTGQCQYTFEGHEAPVYSLCPRRESIQCIFSAAIDGKIKAWVYDRLKSSVEYDAPGHWCTTMSYSADGTRLFSCGTSQCGESYLVEWDETKGAVKRMYSGFHKPSSGVVQFDSTRNRFLAVGDEFRIKFWDIDNTKLLTTINLEGALPASPRVRFNAEGSLLAVTTSDNRIKILANGLKPGILMPRIKKIIHCLSGRLPNARPPSKVARITYNSTGERLLALGSNARLYLWRWPRTEGNPSGKATAIFAPSLWHPASGIWMSNDISETNPEEAVPCMALSKNDSYVISASGAKVSLFNMMTFAVMTTFLPPPPAATFLVFYPKDYNIIAIGMEDSTILIYNVRFDELKCKLKGHGERITGLAFSSSLNVLVSSGADAQLCIWGTDGWEKRMSTFVQVQPGGRWASMEDTRVQFHNDQVRLLVVHESQLAVYDASKLDRIRQWIPEGPSAAGISDATYSCDSQLVYTGFVDGSVMVFDAESLRPLSRLDPSVHTPQGVSGSTVYPSAIAAHPIERNRFALGLSDGGVQVIEPLESVGKW